MRTSPSQFKLLIEYMERHGDLSKCPEGAQAKTANFRLWAELEEILNSDSSGDTKRVEKWRKVWSDLKNNTKKKCAKLRRDAQNSSGGRASSLKLSELEQRVLRLLGTKPARETVSEILVPALEHEPTTDNSNRVMEISPMVHKQHRNSIPVIFKVSTINNSAIQKQSPRPQEKHKLPLNTPNSKLHDLQNNMCNETDRIKSNIQSTADEFHIFGLYVANQLRLLSEEQSVIAREQIQTALTQGRLQDIRKKRSISLSQHNATSASTDSENETQNEFVLCETIDQIKRNRNSAIDSEWDVTIPIDNNILDPVQIKEELSDDEDS